jgi:ectoine hydroxylase-related dioxygenase (phytanoyl-CoA dioxygenase family)
MFLTSKQIRDYQRDGFLTLPDYFTEAELEVLLRELPGLFSEDSPRRILEKSGAVRSVFASHWTNEAFRRLSLLPRMIEPARQLLESEVYVHQFKINAKVALEGDVWEWHQDFLYWHKEDGMPQPRVISMALFLHEVNDFNGPMLLIPGSQRGGMIDIPPDARFDDRGDGLSYDSPFWMPSLTADLKYKLDRQTLNRVLRDSHIVATKGRAGFVVIFDGNTLHASATNLSPLDRVSVFISYNSVANPLAEMPRPRPDFIANRDFTPLTPVTDDALLRLKEER